MRDDSYWFARLVEEVGELGASLVQDHPDTPDHELIQIASICINWLEKRYIELTTLENQNQRTAEPERSTWQGRLPG